MYASFPLPEPSKECTDPSNLEHELETAGGANNLGKSDEDFNL